MEPINILIIVVVYFIATFFGSMIGGGALLTIPALMFFGLSPYMAIGTNKIGALGHTSGAALGYGTEKKIDYKFGFVFMIFITIGSIIGSFAVLSVPEYAIKKLIGMLMLIIAGFLIFKHDFGIKAKKAKRSLVLLVLFALASGFYNGFYGAGIGVINRFVLTAFFAYAVINSAALSTFANIGASLFSLAVFTFYGLVQYALFVPLILASFIGAYLGSRYAVKVGNENVRRILLVAAVIMAIQLLFF